jgi:hypothetical protein
MTTKDRLSHVGGEEPPDPAPQPVYCTLGETLCRVLIWTDQEWARLSPAERPATAAYFPGLGWVGAMPSQGPQ